jgi:DNA-binding transcriptional LysR family regulator
MSIAAGTLRCAELRELRYFIAIAETGHVGRAAERLFIAQPSLSYALKQLERNLRITLCTRHRGGVTLTPAGAQLLPVARRAVRAAQRVESLAESMASGSSGQLLLGFEASGAGAVLTRIRRRFAGEQPRCRARVAPLRLGRGGDRAQGR